MKLAVALVLVAGTAWAQENYEIQIYASQTVRPGATMVETHTNFTPRGIRRTDDGTLPTHHALHETLEITRGWNSWFETGFYLFSSANQGFGWQYVGNHIRPRVRAPDSWRLPVGLSLSTEIGYQRRRYSADTWNVEVRPIVDKQAGKWYLAFNPVFGKSLQGDNAGRGWEFSPSGKAGYALFKRLSGGVEYYGGLGPVASISPLREQGQQIFPTIDVDFGPDWEFNFGVGIGMTGSTDKVLIKMIVGRRFGGKEKAGTAVAAPAR